MDPVLVLRHGDNIPVGLLGDALRAAGVPWEEVFLHAGEPIPPLDAFSALVVMGGVMGAYDEHEYPWLIDEKDAIARAHAAGMPMLGICLGAQLFAEALGGSAYLADSRPEIGHFTPGLTEDGLSDPVLREFDAPVIVFHQDTWDPPPGATTLATSDRFNHAYRLGSAVAIQAHPEADTAIVKDWLAMRDDRGLLDAAGVDPVDLLSAVQDGEPAQRKMAARLFGAWVDEVLASA
jgi:GMP synthase-like glutamine amidotransferase